MLEFYSSLDVDRDEPYGESISFRIGGVAYEVSALRFGVMTGLLTAEEEENESVKKYFENGDLDYSDFLTRIDSYWHSLTGRERHSAQSKASDIRVPILRVIHKMITHSFFHRSTQHDKVYAEDLWVLSYFDQADPERYINVPWALACYMERKGSGVQSDSQLCCGHFITRIVRNLGILNTTTTRACSPPVRYKQITTHDLLTSRLLNPAGTGLIAERARPAAQIEGQQEEQPEEGRRPRRRAPQMAGDVMGRIEEHMAQQTTFMGQQAEHTSRQNLALNQLQWNAHRQNEYIGYHHDRWRPTIEDLMQQNYQGDPYPQYAPPDLYQFSSMWEAMQAPPDPHYQHHEEEEG